LRHSGTVVDSGCHVLKGDNSSYQQQETTLKNIFLCIDTYIYAFMNRPKIDLIKLENSTNLLALNYENLKHVAFLKHVDQDIRVETGKNEL
jgi:hypothetical protein